jgi:hypothetical protein
MTLLSVVKDVCAVVGVLQPQSVFSGIAGNRTMQEMLSLANEMARRIAYDTRDWQTLRATATITGDGTADNFPLPENFKRLMLTSNVWRGTSMTEPMTFISDLDEWVRYSRGNSWSSGIGGGSWMFSGGSLYVRPVLALDETATFHYIDKNCVALASGGFGDRFIADGDRFRLDERLLTLGMIWQWKAQKGSPYAEDMGTYGDALAIAMGHDQPGPILIGRRPLSANSRVAIPSQTIYFPGATP